MDNNDGRFKLIEINTRFWGSLPAAIGSGVDFPKYLVQIQKDDSISFSSDYRINQKYRWWLADLVHLFHVLKGPPQGWKGRYPKRFQTLSEFMKISQYSSYNNELEDILPGTLEILIEIPKKIYKRLGQ
jgi:predicted ATP-grasp superfamily ATP-dependent carboligase